MLPWVVKCEQLHFFSLIFLLSFQGNFHFSSNIVSFGIIVFISREIVFNVSVFFKQRSHPETLTIRHLTRFLEADIVVVVFHKNNYKIAIKQLF